MKFLKKLLTYILILIGALIVLFMILSLINTPEERNIARSYSVSETQNLLIDTWDCGATCPYQAKVILQTVTETGSNELELLSCPHISDIQLSGISKNSAKIESMEGDSSGCKYQVGEILNF